MRAWIMVNARTATLEAGKRIRSELRLPVTSVWGIYDEVVEVNIDSSGKLYDEVIGKLSDEVIAKIDELEEVAACTTYLAIDEKSKRPEKIGKQHAFSLIDTTQPKSKEVRDKLFSLDEVQKADIVLGPFDVIVEYVTDDLPGLFKAQEKLLFGTTGVVKTVTLIAFPERPKIT